MATTLRFSLPGLTTSLGLLFMAGAAALLLAAPVRRPAAPTFPLPQTAIVPAVTLLHRLDGEYSRAGQPVDAPRVTIRLRDLEIMRYQVTAADYARCVADGACKRLDKPAPRGDLPVTGVSHSDATDYAAWLSRETSAVWRLPSDREWAQAAGSRFVDDARGLDPDGANPARRWLADYDRETNRKAASDPVPRPVGSLGANEHGISDIAGNVWEWTTSCYMRATIAADGSVAQSIENCGVRVVGGRHRGYMSNFIRDGKSGGCAAGIAPDNLGIRLIRDAPSLLSTFKTFWARTAG